MVAFPRMETPERPPDNLPLQLSSFVGREREISEVKRLLETSRLLTLTGPGGSGKTRLALAVANDLLEGFEDGVWMVELASLWDLELVPQAVASTLGVREQPDRPLIETLVESVSEKKVLLILDNCEHLLPACAVLADSVLRASPDLCILATSREPLGVAGEISWLVPPLSWPEPHDVLPVEELLRYEAVRLFVERASAALSRFVLTDQNAPAVAEVCQKLEGIPLAIELAAARVRVLPVEQISERLEGCLRFLRTDSRTAVPRQRTLRATIDWSHGLLSEDEQALFRRLSVFSGGFTLEGAEEVCAGEGIEEDEVLDLLSHLVDKSLVLVAQRDGEARYRFLETVKQYAGEKLDDSAEEAAMRRLHAGFFLKLAEVAEPAMLGPEQWTWVGRLEREHDNLRAALRWPREEGEVERGLRLGGALGRFWWFRGYYTEGRAWLEEFLSLPGASGRTAVRAKALYALGILIYQNADYSAGDQEVARSRLEESAEIYRELGDAPHTADVLAHLGRHSTRAADWETARASLEESLRLGRQSGDERGIALARSYLGALYLLRGKHEPARAHLEESLEILRGVGMEEVGTCLWYLGLLACDEGEYATARCHFAEMMEGNPLQRYRYPAPMILWGYARLAAGEGHPARALRLAGAAAVLHQTIGTSAGPGYEAYFRRGLEPARQALSEEEGAIAWAEGQAMTLEEAIAYALDEPTVLQDEGTHPPTTAETVLAEVKTLPELKIFALGPVRVERGEVPLASSEWTYAKARELLFYLLSYPSRTKAQIGLDLWPEASPSQLRRTFHTTLHHLRQALGGVQWICFEKGHYAFNRSLGYFYDVEAFETELSGARRLLESEASTQEAISHLKEALELYRGDFLEDSLEGEWALLRQEELRRSYQEARLTLGALLLGEGRYAEAAEAYRKAIEHDSYLESAHRELMRCYTYQGERGQALRHYRSLVELLGEELGSSPAPQTTDLYERLLQNEEI